MMSVLESLFAQTLLTHPLQVALMVMTLGALVRAIKPAAETLASSIFALVDLSLEAPARVAVASTVVFVVLTILNFAV